MSAHLKLPRIGHLEQVIDTKRKIAFDAAHPSIDERRFKKYDWYDFYCGAKEAILLDCPEPLGKSMSTHCFVDDDLAGNLISRRSQTGFLVFCNRAPIIWHIKWHNAVETSTSGSEIMALKNGVELVEELRYKLRMFGAPIEGATNIYCDNEAVYKNCSIPESILRKKHHIIAYHRNREEVAAGTCQIRRREIEDKSQWLVHQDLSSILREELLDRLMYWGIEKVVVFYY